jgi:hypothetical protein
MGHFTHVGNFTHIPLDSIKKMWHSPCKGVCNAMPHKRKRKAAAKPKRRKPVPKSQQTAVSNLVSQFVREGVRQDVAVAKAISIVRRRKK